MTGIDEFARTLLEEAKRFAERAEESESDEGTAAFLHAALMVGFCALEAHVNSIADDFSGRQDLSAHDKGILFERDVKLDRGEFKVTDQLKITRLEDRIQFLCRRFSNSRIDRSAAWWSELGDALKLRNRLTHPKEAAQITVDTVKRAIQSIINAINFMYKAIYKKKFPSVGYGLQSTLTF